MYHGLFICSRADGHLSPFQFSAVMILIKATLVTAHGSSAVTRLPLSWGKPRAGRLDDVLDAR